MKALVKLNQKTVGTLEKDDTTGHYTFTYKQGYQGPAISRSFKSLTTQYNRSDGNLFPFFSGMLSEGTQKDLQCRLLKIDEKDEFTRLIKTASSAIGAVTVHQLAPKS